MKKNKKLFFFFLFFLLFHFSVFGFNQKIDEILDQSSHQDRLIESYIKEIQSELREEKKQNIKDLFQEDYKKNEETIKKENILENKTKKIPAEYIFSNNELSIPQNDLVRFFIEYYTTVGREYLVRSFKRMEFYYPMVSKYIKEIGLPKDIAALAIIESGYLPRAISQKGALGIWQLMPLTAKIYGLKINDYIDERSDFEKSTQAALLFLKSLSETFNKNWDLIIASYNGGGGYINEQIRKQKDTNFWTLCKTSGFKNETLEFVPRFYAVLTILKNPQKYGFETPQLSEEIPWDKIIMPENLSFDYISKYTGIPVETLEELNPHLKQNMAIKDSFLYIPRNMGDMVFDKLKIALKHQNTNHYQTVQYQNKNQQTSSQKNQNKKEYRKYIIQRGDTIFRIAQTYRVPVEELKSINKLKNNTIHTGQTLLVPVYIAVAAQQNKNQPQNNIQNNKKIKKKNNVIAYTVKKGDTIYSLSKKFGVSIKMLISYNKISEKNLVAGKVLLIPHEES